MFTDAAGNIVTITLTGLGSAVLGFIDATASDPLTFVTTGTTSKSSLSIRVNRGTLTLHDLEVSGSLNALNAPTTTLDGTIQITGTLHTATLDNVTGGPSVIIVDGGGVATTYRLKIVTGLTIMSTAAIVSLTATSWTGGGIDAPSIGTIHINGGLSDSTISLTSPGIALRSLTVGGAVTDSHIATAGSIGAVTVGGMSGSTIFAGVTAGTSALPTAATSLTAGILIKSFNDTGRASTFANSDVVAYSIGTVTLRNVTLNNSGTTFGVAVHQSGSLFLLQPKAKAIHYSAKQLKMTLADLGGDLRYEVL